MEEKFQKHLDQFGEIGFVSESHHSLVHISGLPSAFPGEILLFETGALGQVLSLVKDVVETLVLSSTEVQVGTRVARTARFAEVHPSEKMLGQVITPLGNEFGTPLTISEEYGVQVEQQPPGIQGRGKVTRPFETGVSMVDISVPLGKGQRELVIGDRKTGKTQFLQQAVITQATQGTICVYAAIAKRVIEVKIMKDLFERNKVLKNMVIVASGASESAGLIYLTPYTAMTIAEYFRDQGKDVLVVLDDLSVHAQFYREVTLLAKRFPGRSSYPGDIFYIHARLLERAGQFTKGSITCLPVAESVFGDMTGYIQSNLMSMTDGHLYFDLELYNQGKRPAINPFLSVTRVGLQAQSGLVRDLSRELTGFLVKLERLRQFVHFGAELSDEVKTDLDVGDKIEFFFTQGNFGVIPLPMTVFIVAKVWYGDWKAKSKADVEKEIHNALQLYKTDQKYKKYIDDSVNSSKDFKEFVKLVVASQQPAQPQVKQPVKQVQPVPQAQQPQQQSQQPQPEKKARIKLPFGKK